MYQQVSKSGAKTAAFEYGIANIMQPVMDFTRGYCECDCISCGKVCPNHAIKPLTSEEKQQTKIGYVVYDKTRCVVITDGVHCGAPFIVRQKL